ncbi:PKD domain-containing protein [Candidatus Woesearchaeota archaeon]|nr:MAG: PKD domain-containing protein [Candidatus Woesearchaeota archaeon]
MRNKLMLILAVVSLLAFTACEKPAFIQEYLGPSEEDQGFTVLPPGEGIDVEVPSEPSEQVETPVEEAPEEEQAPAEEEEATEQPVQEEETTEETTEETAGETAEEAASESEMSGKVEEGSIDTTKYVKKIVKEGDLVKLSPKAVDPDGDKITYKFSPPLDENGEWQTKKGDAGMYLVEITASDGKLETTQKLLIVVESVNKAPVIEGLEDITVKEGETVALDFTVSDPDGDDVTTEISGWMTSKEYTTTYDDAGEHTVTVTASDGTDETEKTITVTVLDVNRPPVIEGLDDVEAVEEDEIKLQPVVSDPDGDDVEVTFSEPFNEKGEWETKIGDAGEYKVTVTASDGKDTVEKEITVVVKEKNHPPVIEELAPIEVNEGETVRIEPVVSDPDGDDVELSFSGWMTSSEYTTTYDDAGEYTVTVTASDGKASVSRDVTIIVHDVNRPPEFVLVG